MQIHDARSGYGWLSIALHWAAAISVVMLWFIGNQMTASDIPADEASELLRAHTSVAVTVYLLLLFRVFRRLRLGFPGRSAGQNAVLVRIARVVHFTLLLSVLVMLFTGPLQVWLAGDAIALFNIGEITAPFAANAEAAALLNAAHVAFAKVLLVVFLIHIAGAMRQILFSEGETSNRMLVATEAETRDQR